MVDLSDLDLIDWSATTHVSGPATDIPALIREATSSAEQVQSEALTTLEGLLTHQHVECPKFLVQWL